MSRKNKVIYVKTGDTMHETVKVVSEKLDMTLSEFTREAIREKLARETKKMSGRSPAVESVATI